MREDDLALANIPVHLFWEAKDFSHKNTDSKTLVGQAPQAKMEIWDDTGHFPNLEQPARFLEFLQR